MERPTFYESTAAAHWPACGGGSGAGVDGFDGCPALLPLASSGRGRKWRPARIWRRTRRKCAAYLPGRLNLSRPTAASPREQQTLRRANYLPRRPVCAAPSPIPVKVRANTYLRINYLSCYLKIFGCDAEYCESRTYKIAHANRFPAAGRLMRAGHSAAVGGSGARAYHNPSRSSGERGWACEWDDCSPLNSAD